MEQFGGSMVSQACIPKILKIHFRIFILFQFGISGSSRPTRQTREYRRIGTYDVIVMTPKLFCATSFSLNYCHHLFLSCSFDSWLQSRHYFATVHVIMKMPRYLARPRVARKKNIWILLQACRRCTCIRFAFHCIRHKTFPPSHRICIELFSYCF